MDTIKPLNLVVCMYNYFPLFGNDLPILLFTRTTWRSRRSVESIARILSHSQIVRLYFIWMNELSGTHRRTHALK